MGTNALLQRRGGRVALLTTSGFEDVLEIGRQARPKLYDLFVEKSEPLVPRARRIGVRERLAADGSVILKLTSAELARLTAVVKKRKPESVALCLLFSFRNERHERLVAQTMRAAGYPVSVSHEILPEFREYERTSTTVINAYLVPVMSGYLRDTSIRIAALLSGQDRNKSISKTSRKSRSPLVRIMQSNGGIISAEEAAREPVRTILSGPAGGLIGAAQAAKLAGITTAISFDMGGTSTDVALLSGELHSSSEAMVAGFPVAVPMLEIHTVGAGGGSIARFDAGGALRVGPESAGSVPGPICYGRGREPTVTDAHAVLGHLGTAGLLGGSFALDIPRARTFLEEKLKTSRGTFRSVEGFAHGIIAVANAVMEKAIRVISVERGHDPRDYSLIAFGGAGGLHACDLAAALEMRQVVIPVFPGGLSALGILRADVVKELSRTVLLPAQEIVENPDRLRAVRSALEKKGHRALRSEGFATRAMRFQHSLDMRYVGQAYDLNVLAEGNVTAAFHRAHQQRYGYRHDNRKVEIVNVRCRASGITVKPATHKVSERRRGERTVQPEALKLFFEGRSQNARWYRREKLAASDTLAGPAVVTEYSGTSLIPPGWEGRVDDYGQLVLTRK